ncbi:MAG TPA: zinc ribbon domain-containing protein [Gemmatimonadales bacterium]|nr:zinc ribbon domain-containing protein [Gemmatimonadales bacterium]
MPTYEYKCPKGHVFEKFFPTISNRRKVACPKCGKMAERQLSGGAGLVFKGSGFYITDYKRAGEKQESEPKSETKPETKSESKPDSKSEKKSKKDSPKK